MTAAPKYRNKSRAILWTLILSLFGLSASSIAAASSQEEISHEEQPATCSFTILTPFYVVTDSLEADFLTSFCKATEIPLTQKGKRLEAGPFLSGYEAGWLAQQTPGARAEMRSPLSPVKEPVSQDFLVEVLASISKANKSDPIPIDNVKVLLAEKGKAGRYTVWRLRVQENGKGTQNSPLYYEAYFVEMNTQPVSLALKPTNMLEDDYYQHSFGIALLDTGVIPAAVAVNHRCHGSLGKSETVILTAFPFMKEKGPASKSFPLGVIEFGENPFPEKNKEIEFRTARFSFDKASVKIRRYVISAVATNSGETTVLKVPLTIGETNTAKAETLKITDISVEEDPEMKEMKWELVFH